MGALEKIPRQALQRTSDHLVLTMRLYVNQDAGNVLWEYAFGEEPQAAPEFGFVSADRPHLELGAFLSYADIAVPKNTVLQWTLHGANGSLSSTKTPSTIGVFPNLLNTSVTAGSTYTLDVRVLESEDQRFVPNTKISFGPFEVVPGVPDTIQLSAVNGKTKVLSDGQDSTDIFAVVFDKNGNLVEDGTPVSWSIGYSGYVEKAETQTVDGIASFTYRSGIETTPTDIIARAGQAVSQIEITKTPFDFELSVSGNTIKAGRGGTLSLSIQANAYADNPLEIHWQTDKGTVIGSQTLTSTRATATFDPGLIPGDALITATIAGVEKGVGVSITPSAPGAIAFNLPTIASADSGGSVSIERIDGSFRPISVPTSTSATLYGIPGTEFNLQIGSFFAPNAKPIAHYALSDISYSDVDQLGKPVNSYIYDHVNKINAIVSGDVTEDVEQSYSLPGSSLHFNGSSSLMIPAHPLLEIEDDLFAILKFRRDSVVSVCMSGCVSNPVPLLERAAREELIRSHTGLGVSWVLDLVEDDNHNLRLRATVQTDQGRFAVVSDVVIDNEQWYITGVRIRGGRLELGLNDERQAVAISGNVANVRGSRIVLADDFHGHLDEFKIGQEDLTHALVTVNGKLSDAIPIGSDGTATVNIAATHSGIQVPQMVGFTGTYQTTAGIHTRELDIFEKVVSRITGLPTMSVAYANNPVTTSQEQGLLITSGEVFGWAIDWVDKKIENALGPDIYGPVKQAAKLLYSLLGISDVVTIVDAIIKIATGRIEDVSALDVSFAVLGLGLTVVAVVSAPATVGAGTAAAVGLRTSLAGAKKLLKEMFSLGFNPASLYRAGGSSVRHIFNLLLEFRNGSAAVKARVMADLQDLGNAFTKLIDNASVGFWQFYLGTADSIEGLKRFIRFAKYTDEPVKGCLTLQWVPQDQLYAKVSERLFGLLFIPEAEAAPACPVGLISFIAGVMGRHGSESQRFADEIVDISLKLADMGIPLSMQSYQRIEKLVSKGLGPNVGALMENIAQKKLGNMDATINGMGRVLQNGDTVLDRFFEGLAKLPDGVPGEAEFLRRLHDQNEHWIRAMFAEAESIEKTIAKLATLQPPRRIKDGSIVMGDKVKWNGKENQFGVDWKANLESGEELFVESKIWGISHSPKELFGQYSKHTISKFDELLDANAVPPAFPGGVPKMHYDIRGGFAQKSRDIEDTLRHECKNNADFAIFRAAGFDCDLDLTFSFDANLIPPLVN